ncbi:MAG TPA: hypothetical protein VI072_33655 [Polyangiaceae bacterium]
MTDLEEGDGMKYKTRFNYLFTCVAGLVMACGADVDPAHENGGDAPLASSDTTTGTTADALTTTDAQGVRIELRKKRASSVYSFGVPVPKGALSSATTVQVLVGGVRVPAKVRELLKHYDGSGRATGVAAIQVQIPASSALATDFAVDIKWAGGSSSSAGYVTYSAVSALAPALAKTTVRGITQTSGVYRFTETAPVTKTVFSGREQNVIPKFPDGYLGRSDVLGPQMSAAEAAASPSTGLAFLSSNFKGFTLSSMYDDGYAHHVDPGSVTDLTTDYSAWLYDRCATYLTATAHFNEHRFAEFGFKTCSYFASRIGLSGTALGIFSGKPTPDTKYSHARGLYAYYAMTGDEQARAAVIAIADMWLSDATFVTPYRSGKLRGPDKLWTERLLATSLEGLLYGYRMTGATKYLIAVEEMVDTAYLHITGSAAQLAAINPGATFPPQNCFIHSSLQQAEGVATTPWCSPWMSELVVESLLHYQALTQDTRVDEIFIRLGRFLRDVGTAYFTKDVQNDTFMKPAVCDVPTAGSSRRRLVPLYGAGLNQSRVRVSTREYTDFEHCADATALSAAALRSLKRTGQYNMRPIGPFANEGASILQLHHELLSCAQRTFTEQTRARRNPAVWTSKELAAGASNPASFILQNKVGFPMHMMQPARKLSWWFNTSVLQLKMLQEAGITIGTLTPGKIQPTTCG